MQSLRRCRRVRCAPIKKSLSKQALKGTRTRLWSNKTKIAKLSELHKNELVPRGAGAYHARCLWILRWRRWLCGGSLVRTVRGVGADAVRIGARAVHVVAKCGGVVPVPACTIGRSAHRVPPDNVPHALYAQEPCGDIAKPVLTKAGN